MTRSISFIVGAAVTALVVAVPAAFGEGRLAGSQGQDATLASSQAGSVVSRPDSHELIQSSASVVSRPDSHELIQSTASVVSRPDSHETVQPYSYMDAAERADRISNAPGRDVVLLSGDDHTFQPVDTSTPVASTDGNRDWPQVGIGFGVGLALVLGLILVLRATRQRPLAH